VSGVAMICTENIDAAVSEQVVDCREQVTGDVRHIAR